MKRWTDTAASTLREIAELIARGGVVLLPTDTIYGLHASASNEQAVARIAAMKGRPDEKPFIVLAESIAGVRALGAVVPEVLNDIWPAPLTAILQCGDG